MEVLLALLVVALLLWLVIATAAGLIRWCYRIAYRLAVSRVRDFSPTWITVGVNVRAVLALDEQRSTIALMDDRDRSPRRYSYRDTHSVEIVEDGVSITRTDRASQLGGALVGAALVGGVGLLAGAVTGKKTTENRVDRVELHIVVDDPRKPLFTLCLFRCSWLRKIDEERGRSRYLAARDIGRLWQARITVLIRKANREVPTATTAAPDYSISAEISRLAELNKSGALTDEEFRLAKRTLLTQLGTPPVLEPR